LPTNQYSKIGKFVVLRDHHALGVLVRPPA
jgi:hypothetical protein